MIRCGVWAQVSVQGSYVSSVLGGAQQKVTRVISCNEWLSGKSKRSRSEVRGQIRGQGSRRSLRSSHVMSLCAQVRGQGQRSEVRLGVRAAEGHSGHLM